jgi:octaprenyl-diphosphate synthase
MSNQSNLRVTVTDHKPKPDPVLTTLADTTQRNRVTDVATRLAEMRDWLADDLTDLEHDLSHVIADPQADLAWSAAEYLLQKAGKRVRPICVMLAAQMGGRAFDHEVKQIAICAELVHAATLMHDDVIDQGEDRRGRPTARMVYGNAASVLGGDHLLVGALQRVHTADPGLTGSLLGVIADMVHAEALQLELRKSFKPDRNLYRQVVEGKTAALFRWALEAGGRLGRLTPDHAALLGEVGANLGMTFQLVDDKLDLCGNPKETGKDTCLDLREGKLTWPMILAAERSPRLLLRLGHFASSDQELDLSEMTQMVKEIRDTGAIEDTQAEAERFAQLAADALEKLPLGRAHNALRAVIQTALYRSR